ncbi:MAG: thymidylate synthase [Bacillota bacterium]|nr:thymidylate synthase [Bacillota bacterium]
MAYADQLFIENCRQIIDHGYWDSDAEVRPRWDDGSPAHSVKSFAIVNRYDLTAEFPILTLRRTNFRAAFDEILWIWQKKSNNVHDLNSHIWDAWADESGSIGKAYGYQLGVKYDYPEGRFDQVDMLRYNLRHNPASRRMVSNIFVHSDLKQMHLYPCAYSFTLNASGNVLNGLLNQRSQDMLVANNWNVVQYALLLQMFADDAGMQAGELVHMIADAHIYDRHVPIVEQLLQRQPLPAPRLLRNGEPRGFYEVDVDSFYLEDYRYHKLEGKIPVAV